MMKRNGVAMVVGCVVCVGAAIASCSFPTYNITVTGSGGASASASSGSVGGGGASGTASSGTVGGGGASGTTSTSGASSSGGTGGFDPGSCPVDEDGDGAISWECPGGTDCADQDKRAHPGADFLPGPAISGKRSPFTLAFDFDCDGAVVKQTKTIDCSGALCGTPTTGYKQDVACGDSAAIGKCAGALPCAWTSLSTDTLEFCK